ncbi:MAG: prolipoprotein diacylglyceryl transferase [bacterium]
MHPVLFYIGNFYVGTYGALIALGLVAGVSVAVWRAGKVGIDSNLVLVVAFYGVLAGLVGARVTYILLSWGDFLRSPAEYLFSRTGFVFGGGLVFGIAVTIWLLRRRGQEKWAFGDVAAPSLALGHFFGRLGCFMAGCCFGKVCSVDFAWLGVRFPEVVDKGGEAIGSFPFLYQLQEAMIPPDAHQSLLIYPTQLFEAGALLIIFGILQLAWRRRRFDGQIFLLYLMLYGAARFGVEFLRGDMDRGFFDGLATSQWLSLMAVVFAAVYWFRLRRRGLAVAQKPASSKTKMKSARKPSLRAS